MKNPFFDDNNLIILGEDRIGTRVPADVLSQDHINAVNQHGYHIADHHDDRVEITVKNKKGFIEHLTIKKEEHPQSKGHKHCKVKYCDSRGKSVFVAKLYNNSVNQVQKNLYGDYVSFDEMQTLIPHELLSSAMESADKDKMMGLLDRIHENEKY